MANGNIVDAATYYNDPVTYTGDGGSSTNPWCIEDVYDFLNVQSKPHATYSWNNNGHFILVKDINFNDHETYRYGFNSSYIINFDVTGMYLDGKGHKISNMILYTNAVQLRLAGLSNTEFANLILVGVSSEWNMNHYYSGNYSCTNCKFGILVNNSNVPILGSFDNFTDCTFNIYGTTNTAIVFGNSSSQIVTYTRCLFNFNLSMLTVQSPMFKKSSPNYNKNFVNCAFTGKINNNFDSGSYFYVFDEGNYLRFRSSYYAVETVIGKSGTSWGSGYSIILRFGAQADSTCFWDTDRTTSSYTSDPRYTVSWSVPQLLELCTTEQAQDANYLQSIGFLTV